MFDQIINLIISPELQATLLPLKVIFFTLDILMAAFLIFAFFKTRWFKLLFWYSFVEFFTMKTYGSYLLKTRLTIIMTKAKDVKGDNHNDLIIRLHKMLEACLEGMASMHQARTFSEKLAKIGGTTFSDISGVWEMHEVYRKIKNDKNYVVDQTTFLRSFEATKHLLIDLGVE